MVKKYQAGLKGRVLKLAAKEFAKKGFNKACTRDIAKAAKTSESAMYYIFSSKDEILAEILKQGWGDILISAKHQLSGISDPIEMMQKLFEVVCGYLLEDEPEIGAVMLIDGRKEWGIQEKLITAEQREVFEMMERIIEEAQRVGIYDTGFNIEAARQGLFGLGEDLVLGLYLRPRTDYKANYSFEDAAQICAKMQGAFFTLNKIVQDAKKDSGKKKELVSLIARDEDLFRMIKKERAKNREKDWGEN